LVRKAYLFIEKLSYDPENLSVLAPGKADLELLAGMLGRAGYACVNIRDDGFTFKEQKTVRLSTLHSSKGLDFPVVLLFLPGLPPRGEYSEEEAERLQRNLIYVAMTRAMDNLNVFTLEAPREKPMQDLQRVFAEQAAASGSPA
jgi:superfamily I DNA/RNA helicase